MIYLHVFENQESYNGLRYGTYREPWVSTIKNLPDNVEYNREELEQPLTFEIKTGGKIYWKLSASSGTSKVIEYRIWNDKHEATEWTTITSSTEGTEITVEAGDRAFLRIGIQLPEYGETSLPNLQQLEP